MRRSVLAVSCIAAFGLAACQDPLTEPAPVALEPMASSLSAEGEFVVDRAAITLPDGRVADRELLEICSRAINGEDYVCPPSTEVIDWFLDAFFSALAAERSNALNMLSLATDAVVAYDAMLYLDASQPQSFGFNGEYTEVLLETERDIKRFWDIESSDIQMVPLHGTMLLDTARVARVYRTVFGIPAGTASFFASFVRNILLTSVAFNGGNHPLFSFNAFASSFGAPFHDRISMGDGMMAGYAAVGFGDVAPQAVFAHEFAHHIQFENGYFENDALANSPDTASNTRYTELMADAYSAYYLTHKRGLAMNKHRVAQFLEAFFQIGDCAFDNHGHHGTPNQRMRAAEFGFVVADEARKQGHILSSEAFHALFVAEFPDLIAPDAI